jgi:hypothetical protein
VESVGAAQGPFQARMVARPRWAPLAFALLARLLSVDGGIGPRAGEQGL